jgi:hypothetical protein
MTYVPLDSSHLAAANYDASTGVLLIRFTNGAVYRYTGIDADIYAGLLAASSPGAYFHAAIKPAGGERIE